MERHDWLPREEGGGEDSAGDSIDRRIPSTSGAWNHGRQASACGLKKAYVSQENAGS